MTITCPVCGGDGIEYELPCPYCDHNSSDRFCDCDTCHAYDELGNEED